jgi:fumarate reductase flavoprotein subunit
MYSLFDDKIRHDVEGRGMLVGRGWGKDENAQRKAVPGFEEVLRRRDAMGGDTLVKISDTWDGIADWIGAAPEVLKAEIEAYNNYCDHGYDEDFLKERKYLKPLRQPPYYAIRGITSFGGTLGGIKVNEHMEALDTQYNVIPGLFVAGVIADGGAGCVSPFGFAMNSGRIAGESAADYVKSIRK